MPIYEYVCRTCSSRFDKLRPIADRLSPPPCPNCGTRTTTLAMSAPGHVGSAPDAFPARSCGNGDGSCCGGVCLN